jgi:hypothetical protein
MDCPICRYIEGNPVVDAASSDTQCAQHGSVLLHSEGGFGKVYLCRPTATVAVEQPYIVKVLKHVGCTEASHLATCAHQNVVRQFSSFVTKDQQYLVIQMEYCSLGDLHREIANRRSAVPRRRFTEDEVLSMLAQLLLALQYVHSNNVLHRDIKSANVLLTKDPTSSFPLVKLGDFGLAKLDDLTISDDWERTFCGTVPNIAPEMLTRRAVSGRKSLYSKAAEVWSLGVVLHEMMSLSPPFTGEPEVVLQKILRRDFIRVEDGWYSDRLIQLVDDEMLCQDASTRASLHQIAQVPCVMKAIQDYISRFPDNVILQHQQQELLEVACPTTFGTFHRLTRAGGLAPYILGLDQQYVYLRDAGSGDVRRLERQTILGVKEDDLTEDNGMDGLEEEEDEEEGYHQEGAMGEDSEVGARPKGQHGTASVWYGVELRYLTPTQPQPKTILLYSATKEARDAFTQQFRSVKESV